MHRQVGDLKINTLGIAEKGLLIRHLVMPENAAGTRKIMDFLGRDISTDTYINIMTQYHPCGNAWDIPTLNRPINRKEYLDAIQDAVAAGLTRLDKQ